MEHEHSVLKVPVRANHIGPPRSQEKRKEKREEEPKKKRKSLPLQNIKRLHPISKQNPRTGESHSPHASTSTPKEKPKERKAKRKETKNKKKPKEKKSQKKETKNKKSPDILHLQYIGAISTRRANVIRPYLSS